MYKVKKPKKNSVPTTEQLVSWWLSYNPIPPEPISKAQQEYLKKVVDNKFDKIYGGLTTQEIDYEAM